MDKEIINLPDYQKKLFSTALKTGIIVEMIIHEISHNIDSLYFYSKNIKIPLLTPRKEGLIEG